MSNRTTIIVAHRLSTIRAVDTIVVLKNGRVVESGNHLELMSDKKGAYATLVSLQEWKLLYLLLESPILRNEIGWFDLDENNTGSLVSNLAAGATLLRSTLADRVSTIVQNLALTVIVFIIAFTLSWCIASVVIATFPLLIGASITEQLFLQGFGGDYTQAYSRATSVAREAITNIRTVAAFGAEARIVSHFTSELNEPNKLALGMMHHNSLDSAPMHSAYVFSILERRTAIDPNDSTSEGVTEIEDDVEFRNVSFSYPMRPDVSVFKDLNLRVSAGSNLALVGPSGSGKSSVIALMMRFYDPTSGSILIDGRVIRCLNLRSLRLKIGLVQQEPALFSTTVYENIQYGKDGASEIEVIRAAKAANAHGFISRMPEGYHTQVGERGVQLSGGQKQKVAIARAILKDPTILLLDEATSALDSASEMTVQEALDKLMKGRATIIVTHRLSTIRDVDMICVLQHGKVVEHGSHEELMKL
ncbi:hypothetical protein IFM89_016891 [Coptis chinensis]|uniref:Uncharacterized protein n=1 Tax=Coptis chinensis TaxID=261450 RepID=A0A835HYZ9_9MAGN|nr:hypothetical protein IFM89_016891 [Coptis chinensis]